MRARLNNITIARVFPRQTSMSPTDKDCYFGEPGLFTPKYDEIHISTVFTWDIERAKELKHQWELYGKVLIGGPAIDDPGGEFLPGMYMKPGVTITSRGCCNSCSFCFVPKREGRIRELEIKPGNIIQDNNLLACSKEHIEKVFKMLKTQRAIEFKGGLDYRLLSDSLIKKLSRLRVKAIWIACDKPNNLKGVIKTIEKLRAAGFSQAKIFVFCLIGFDQAEEHDRMIRIFNAGGMPFAQLFRSEEPIAYSKDWKDFNRFWSRPAAYKSAIKNDNIHWGDYERKNT